MNPTHMSFRQATQTSHTKKIRGFTLIELMIVIVIIGILAGIGYPMYTDQIRKSRRSTAQSTLSDAAARMEQFFLDNKSYANDVSELGYGVAAGAPYPTPEGFYDITVDAPIVGVCPLATCYALTATAINLQTDDTDCPTITLDSRGNRGPAGSGCW